MKRINLITKDNNTGLSRDTAIVAGVLRQAGFRVTVDAVGKPTLAHKWQRVTAPLRQAASYALTGSPPYDINLFLEDVVPSRLSYASVNCLIPNQEYFRDEWRPYLAKFDCILCKTKFAQGIFDALGCKTEYISFTSFDRFNEKPTKNYDIFFHLAGGSFQKGTKTIIDIWVRHPEWPRLTVISHRQTARCVSSPNIEYIYEFLDDAVLCEYQNSHGIHLCPSEAEGYGHSIGEAMSCKAVTITTNAPPMNELVAPGRGILVDYRRTEVQQLGINYYVDERDIEQKVNEVMGMDGASKKQLGENAQDWYQQNDQFFRRRIVEVIGDM
jgi:hypothetical protein